MSKATKITRQRFNLDNGVEPELCESAHKEIERITETSIVYDMDADEYIFTGANCKYARKIWTVLAKKIDEVFEGNCSEEAAVTLLKQILSTTYKDDNFSAINIGGLSIKAKTPNQSDYIDQLQNHRLVFGFGPAGTGKTYLAILMMCARLKAKEIDGIVIARPAVDAGEKIGFLPGNEAEKMDPFLRPCLDVLEEVFGVDEVKKMIEDRIIQCNNIGYFRGRTIKNKGVVLDESQNATPENIRMILTRLGEGSFMVVNGDNEQADIPGIDGVTYLLEVFEKSGRLPLDGALMEFDAGDCVRDPIVADLLEMFSVHKDWWEEFKEEQRQKALEKAAKKEVERQMIKHGDLPPID